MPIPKAREGPRQPGEMARLIQSHEWAATPLGPRDGWPQQLKCLVDVILTAGFPMIILWGDELTQIYNDHYRDLMGNKHPGGLGQPTRDCWPEVWHINRPIFQRVRQGESVSLQDALFPIARHGTFEDAWFTLSYAPLGNGGEISGILITIFETTEAVRARIALRTSEEQLRLIVENARDYAIFTTDVNGLVTDWRGGAEAVFGFTREDIIGRDMALLFTPEDREAGEPEKERATAAQTGKAPNVRWHVRKDGSRVFIEGVVTALKDAENGAIAGFLKIGRDATERHAGEERQNTLLFELQHRVRNILAIIRSIARRSAETAEDVEEYQQHLEGRITSLARTQVLLTRNVGSHIDLQNMILDELDAQAAQPGQFTLAGPDVSLPPKAAEVLGLAIHELATNAIKYGALANPGGHIDIRWNLVPGGEAPRLELTWSESGVSLDGAPSREGFGFMLIKERVPYELRGTGKLQFKEDGIIATIEFPLESTSSILQTDAKPGSSV